MKPFRNLTDVLAYGAGTGKSIVFIHKKSEIRMTYRELYARSLRAASRLRSKGCRMQDEVVIRLEDPQSFLIAFWGCLVAGMVPVPLAAGGSEEHLAKLRQVWRRLNRPWLLSDPDFTASEGDPWGAGRSLAPEELLNKGEDMAEAAIDEGSARRLASEPIDEADLPCRPDSGAIAFIQFSSGSTGDPKGVVLTHANLLSNMAAIVACSGTTERDSSLSWMPLTHDMGLIGFHLSPMYAGMDQYIMRPSQFMLDPMLWLSKAHEHRITSLASPNFGYRHFLASYKSKHAEGWDLSCVRLIFNGAEPISAEWAEKFLAEMAPHGLASGAMFPVYGMAEATLAVTFPPAGERLTSVRLDPEALRIGGEVRLAEAGEDRAVSFVDVGSPVRDCEVRIADESEAPLPEGRIGHIFIRGANVAGGYYNDPQSTERALAPDGWLRTGDIGYMSGGRLVVTGRRKDIIFVRGRNVYPHDLEQRAEAADGVGYGKVAACGVRSPAAGEEEIVLFVQHRGKPEKFAATAERLRRRLNRETGLDIGRVVPVRQLPRTTSGKIQRYKLVERLNAGEWDEALSELESLRSETEAAASIAAPSASVASSEHPDLRRLAAIWSDTLGLGYIGADDHFQESGGNSLKAAQALAGIRMEWGVELSFRDLYDCPTPRLLLERIHREGSQPSSEPLSLPPAPIRADGRYPTTIAQRRMALAEQAEDIGCAYHIPVALAVEGPMEAELLREALQALIDRHDMLRASFHWEQGELVQQIHHPGEVAADLKVYECAAADFPDPGKPEDAALGDSLAPFDLSCPPMFRAAMWTDGAYRHLLLLNVHHIAADGIGMNVLMKEFAALLGGASSPNPVRSYIDYAVWEREASPHWKPESESFWMEQLKTAYPALQWPDAASRPARRTYRGGMVRKEVPADTVRSWERQARQDSATMASLLLSLHAVTVSRYARQPELSIGLLVAGRTHPDTSAMVGMFNNFVPIRLAADGSLSFGELRRLAQDKLWDALSHAEVPYERLIELSGERTERSRNPLFDTMLVYHNQAETAAVRFEAGGCRFAQLRVETGTAKLDLKLDVFPEPSGALSCIWEYNERLFRPETIERLADHFIRLAATTLREPGAKLADIDLMSEAEREVVVERFNATQAPFPDVLTLPDMFRQQADRTPERIAAVFGDGESLTYRELDARANRVAQALLEGGLSPEEPVGLMTERSSAMLAGMLGILRAGGAYVPLPPSFPADRLRYMAEDCGLRVVCAQRERLSTAKQAAPNARRIDLDDARLREADGMSGAIDTDLAKPEGLAYILYTSGSTGRPKGVMIRHRSVLNRLNWMQRAYPLGSDDVILQKTPYSFDVSVWELFWWMLAGAGAAFLPPDAEKDPAAITEAIRTHGVTTMHFVPSMLASFLEASQHASIEELRERLGTLKRVFASGEALHRTHVERFYALMYSLGLADAKLINLYGPTEATVDVTVHECEAESELDFVPIGRPIDNTSLYVIGEGGLAQPIGVPGELCIAGAQLATGYVNRPDLTAEKFVPHPYAPGEVMYRTGDLARWMADGQLQYLGRIDDQVKIRGYRIELGEIERTLLLHKAVSEAVVSARDDGSGGQRLVGYVVADRACAPSELRKHCGDRLLSYMIPEAFVQLEAMPLTTSGKADRKALPEPERELSAGTAYAAPRTETERKLAILWAESLGREKVGIEDNFFELGGHSLTGASLVAVILREFGHLFALRDLFELPTVRELAQRLEARSADGLANGYMPIPKAPPKQSYPLASAQNRLFILQSMDENATAYHLSFALRIRGPLERERLLAAMRAIFRRHDALRASFEWEDGRPVQRIAPDSVMEVEYEEVAALEPEACLQALIRPFRLQEPPLVRVKLLRRSNVSAEATSSDASTDHLLLVDAHHLVTDGVSMAVLGRQFIAHYEGAPVAELPVQYPDYADWQARWLQSEACQAQERYWLDKLSGAIPALQWPSDLPRPRRMDYAGDEVTVALNTSMTRALADFGTRSGTTLYMTLLAMFSALLHRYTRQSDIWIGSPVAGRPHPDLAEVIGMFVNTVVIRSQPVGDFTFNDLAAQTKDCVLGALEHDRYPFELLVEKLGASRDVGRNPLFDVMFVMQNTGIPAVASGKTVFEPCYIRSKTSKFDLMLDVTERGDELICRFEYRTSLFRRETIERMADHFIRLAATALRDPNVKLADIDLMSETERRIVVEQFNATQAPFPDDRTLPEMFRLQAERTPGRTAAVFGDGESLSYRELDARANQIARTLLNGGLSPDEPVGLMAERSSAMLAGMLGILRAGGAYVPLPPSFPADRLRYMAEDCGLRVVCTQVAWLSAAEQAAPNARRIDLDDARLREADGMSGAIGAGLAKPEGLAYILYTSGSTGRPKGVMIRHRSVMNRLNWMQRAYPLGSDDVILQKTPYSFDVSVWELFWWMLAGASVAFLPPDAEKDPRAMADAIRTHGVTTMHFVPSMLAAFLEAMQHAPHEELRAGLGTLKRVFTSGEALHRTHVERFYALTRSLGLADTELINLYGPTEATVDVTAHECEAESELDFVPIGRPIDNTSLYVIGEGGLAQPIGVPGELCIAGVQVAAGYVNRPDLTAEKFVPHPYAPGEVMYRTGDLARWMSDGQLQYLGRIDDQVKIRGYRIEPGEIERTLLLHASISEAIVTARDDGRGGNRLVGYVIADRECSANELRRHCGDRLPSYMIPEAFVQLEAMPLTASGKADRKSLPEPERELPPGTAYAAPRTETEAKLAALWGELLMRERVGVEDNFFELGGHSLLLVQLHKRLAENVREAVSVTDLFAYPTIAKLAAHLDQSTRTASRQALVPLLTPDALRPAAGQPQSRSYLRLTLHETTVRELRLLAEGERIEPAMAALGLWVILIARMFRQPRFDLPVAGLGRGIRVAEIDLNAMNGFSGLIEYLRMLPEAESEEPNPAQPITNAAGLLPFYRIGLFGELPREWRERPDLTIAVETGSSAWAIELEYNAGKIRAEKLKEMLQSFPTWCRRMAQDSRVGSVSAAARTDAVQLREEPK
ncbi:surfactin family lipopeptide synthetase A/fengycin family lipopeptide synthetase D [Paenibacillus methanolicus]|uniref:Surfactin family lipopeptide synthetase A/fengycin family lipopeptide synthetase D n=2 Tax=Paenibacillus methanolicus TaxID=582686 RepID=A0A5S5CKR5_9BACL|nr:surfactin family lipopeptide synthetase A/fengycin family lipopeptide synthetase D [Paenibacillus methanolicus]